MNNKSIVESRIIRCKSVCAVIAIQTILANVCLSSALWNVQNTFYLGVTSQEVTYGYTLTIANEAFDTGDFTGTAAHDGQMYPISGNTSGNSISWNDPQLLGCGGTLYGSIDTNGVLYGGGGNLSNCGSEWSAIWGESSPAYASLYAGPTFTLQPISVICSQGNQATFTANAVGSPDPTYQWQFNGTNIADATNTSYTIPVTTVTNLGIYDVVASNVVGTNASDNASLSFLDVRCLPSLILYGPVGASYAIQEATSLGGGTNWMTITNITLTASQPYIFTDPTTVTNSGAFYRAIPN